MKRLASIVAFLALCGAGCAHEQSPDGPEAVHEQTVLAEAPSREYVVRTADVEPRIERFYFNTISMDLTMAVSDTLGGNNGLEYLELYRDGEMVLRYELGGQDTYLTRYELDSLTPPRHYTIEVRDIGGHEVVSEPKEVSPEAAKDADTSPLFRWFLFDEATQSLSIGAEDYIFGPNPGLVQMTVYEGGKILKSFDIYGRRFDTQVKLEDRISTVPKTYFAEVTDLADQTTRSKTISVRLE